MPRSPRWSARLATLVAGAAIVFSACSGTTSPSTAPASGTTASEAPASAAPASAPGSGAASPAASQAAASRGPFTATDIYPVDADAPCGVAPYTGIIKRIKAVDKKTVEFDMCATDVAFLQKIAFSSFGIQDSDYLAKHMADKTIVTQPNGTGPYKIDKWDKGNRITFTRNDAYWGDKAKTPNLELRWSETGAQRLVELKSGTVDGIDNPGKEEMATISADPTLKLYPRQPMNVSYIGFNKTKAPWDKEDVRKAIAMGIDRDRLVKNFYPDTSVVANKFTPCPPLVPFGCEGDDWYPFDAAQGKQLLQNAGFDFSKTYPLSFRAAVRPYSPDPPVIAQELKDQLEQNLGIKTTLDLQDSPTFRANVSKGTYDGMIMYGWGADYPDVTNFLDFHFGAGSGPKFGGPFDDIAKALTKGATSPADADRKAAYVEANNLIKQHVPVVPLVHGASGTAFLADVTGAHASPLTTELFYVVQAKDDTLTFMQGAEPIGLYCGDESDGESLRACEQTNEALYGYKIGETAVVPALATSCTSNTDKSVWTCKLRDGVKFHDGADFDATDVVTTFATQWDNNHPLHTGNTGDFEYFAGLWGGFLNPAP